MSAILSDDESAPIDSNPFTSSLPPIFRFPSLPRHDKFSILTTLFEQSPALESTISPQISTNSKYHSYSELIEAIRKRLFECKESNGKKDRDALIEILGSHPRLGEPKGKEQLSEMSRAEQEVAGLVPGANEANSVVSSRVHDGEVHEARKLRELNREYEEKFPGLRYVVFVNAQPRNVILQNMRDRIDRADFEKEVEEGINAVCNIAYDRVKKLGSE